MDAVKDVLGKWGKKAAEASKKAEDLAGNVWQHCKFESLLAILALSLLTNAIFLIHVFASCTTSCSPYCIWKMLIFTISFGAYCVVKGF